MRLALLLALALLAPIALVGPAHADPVEVCAFDFENDCGGTVCVEVLDRVRKCGPPIIP